MGGNLASIISRSEQGMLPMSSKLCAYGLDIQHSRCCMSVCVAFWLDWTKMAQCFGMLRMSSKPLNMHRPTVWWCCFLFSVSVESHGWIRLDRPLDWFEFFEKRWILLDGRTAKAIHKLGICKYKWNVILSNFVVFAFLLLNTHTTSDSPFQLNKHRSFHHSWNDVSSRSVSNLFN